jgi:hypothetical protein
MSMRITTEQEQRNFTLGRGWNLMSGFGVNMRA